MSLIVFLLLYCFRLGSICSVDVFVFFFFIGLLLFFFFFFQAEDGIRDLYVTGVQTCALPICLALGRWARAWSMAPGSPAAMPRASFLACLRRDSSEGRAGSFDVVITPPFKSACDPLIQAERRCKARCLDQSRWDLFPCRGSVVPCRTLPLVSATCRGTVKPRFHGPFLAVYSRTLEIAAGSRATLP